MKAIFFNDIENDHLTEIFKELYKDKVYKPYLEGKKDLTILDIGANQGLTTYYFYQFAKRIYSIEPSKRHVEVLKAMLKFNDMEDKVTVIQKALSHESGTKTFFHNTNTTMFSLKGLVSDKGEKEEVDTITFDILFKENNIDHVDFVKLDIEGSECEVLASEGFEKVASKIDLIVGEYHQWSGVNPGQLASSLRDNGFTFDWLNKTEASIFVSRRA
mgnify:CR=1 FL=1